MLTGALRKDFSLEYTRKFAITNTDREIHRGIARYHRDIVFLDSSKKSTEPKRDVMLNDSMMSMKSKSDTITSGVVTDMQRNMTDTKPVTHVIIKTADVNASAIFILIKSSPQNVKSDESETGCHKAINETLTTASCWLQYDSPFIQGAAAPSPSYEMDILT